MDQQQLIDHLIQETEQMLEYVVKELSPLPDEVLVKRPSKKHWSIIECLEHMNISSGHYIKRLDQYIDSEAVQKGSRESIRYKPGWLGEKFSTGILPNEKGEVTNKMKTFFLFEPKKAIDKGRLSLDEFIAMNKRTIELLDASRQIDLNKGRITSTLGSVIRFKTGDAFRFAIGHNIRHMVQIKRTLANL